jgi:hypothetical protein
MNRYLDQISQPSTRAQYRTAIERWDRMPNQPGAQEPPIVETKPNNPPKPIPPRTRGRSGRVSLRTSEQRLLYQLGRTGIAEHQRHARGFARVDEKRLRLLVRKGFLEVNNGFAKPRGREAMSVRYYSLGSRGRSWLRRHGVGHLYRWNPQQINHDLHLTDVYYQLPPKIRRTWITESQLIAHLRQQGRFVVGHAVDGVVFIDGQAHAIEVAIGYKRADIAKKAAFIQSYFSGRGTLIT